MIGRIAGIVLHRGADHALLDVRGVGYIVQASDRTLAALPRVGEAAALWTEMIVREDALILVGFQTLAEKEWFRLLTGVQGVGAKAALSILGTLGADALSRAIALGDVRAVQGAPGVGPKLATRIVMELKAKAPSVMAMGAAAQVVAAPEDAVIDPAPPLRPPRPAAAPAATAEALSALTNLGYGPGDAAAAVATAAAERPEAVTPDLIRAALRLLAPRG